MDQEQGPPLKAGPIPRLSRLPMPRASHDNLRLARATGSTLNQEPVKTSPLPRPSKNRVASIVPPSPLSENVNKSLRDRYGWTSQNGKARSRSPVRDALQTAQSNALETTPPSSHPDIPVFEDGDENPQPELIKERPRHRMSLTERTVETLSQISPSPSPTRRRESIISNDGCMGPPPRPVSSMRVSRPTTPARSQSQSPVRQPFRPPGKSESPRKEHTLPAVPSPGSLFSPQRALVKGGSSRIAKPWRDSRRSVSNVAVVNAEQSTARVPSTYTAQTMRVKNSYHENSHSNKVNAPRSLGAIFKDPPLASQAHLAATSPNQTNGLLRPRLRGENTIASSPTSNTKKKLSKPSQSRIQDPPAAIEFPGSSIPGPKSSAALRESIAKAKAARKNASAKVTADAAPSGSWPEVQGFTNPEADAQDSNRGLLGKRIDGALASGHLNISAMKLASIPSEVMNMYEPNKAVNWAEVVDMTKFIAADNQIEQLQEEVFPDCSLEEVIQDDEKSNQFGGIEILDLHNNLLNCLPVGLRRLERLANLNLSANKLSNSSLDIIWQLPQLRELNLARNRLTDTISLPSRLMQTLQALSLQENQIEQIGFGTGIESAISRLDVSSNKLTKLPWELLSTFNLAYLNASANQLSGTVLEAPVHGFANMRELDLSRNSIEGLGGSLTLAELQTFKINRNKLESLPDLSTWQSLMTIQASDNQLSELPSGIIACKLLKNADFSQNNIKAIHAEVAHMESLASLQLGGNPLRDRKYLTMECEDLKADLLRRFGPALPSNGTQLTTASRHTSSTESTTRAPLSTSDYLCKPLNGTLELSSKCVTSIDITTIDLSSSTPIHSLRLSNNNLTAFPFELLSHPSLKWSLRSLDLSHNPLTPTDYLKEDLFLPNLQSLYIVSTGLTSLDALTTHLKTPELKELNISCHRLSGHLPWVRAWFSNCTTLLATDNWFSSVDVEAVRGLEVLDLRNNEIEALPPKIGLLGNHVGKTEPGRLRSFECGGNKFRVPRNMVIEKGTEAVLKDLRRMVAVTDVPEEWKDEI